MPILVSLAAAVSISTVPDCSWNRPGRDPFTGDAVAAVDDYVDIAPATRERLKARLRARDFDDDVVIGRDAIGGAHGYDPRIRDMHFGAHRLCRDVHRTGWTADHHEPGRVLCEDGQCLLVPTVCGNLSRVVRREHAARSDRDEEMAFEPPSAGPGGAGGGGGGGGPITESAEPGIVPVELGSLAPPPVAATGPVLGGHEPWGIPMPVGGGLPRPPVIVVTSPVPEPPAWALLGGGLALLAWRKRLPRQP